MLATRHFMYYPFISYYLFFMHVQAIKINTNALKAPLLLPGGRFICRSNVPRLYSPKSMYSIAISMGSKHLEGAITPTLLSGELHAATLRLESSHNLQQLTGAVDYIVRRLMYLYNRMRIDPISNLESHKFIQDYSSRLVGALVSNTRENYRACMKQVLLPWYHGAVVKLCLWVQFQELVETFLDALAKLSVEDYGACMQKEIFRDLEGRADAKYWELLHWKSIKLGVVVALKVVLLWLFNQAIAPMLMMHLSKFLAAIFPGLDALTRNAIITLS